MMVKLWLVGLCALFFNASALAENAALPAVLMWHGKPINPYCIAQLAGDGVEQKEGEVKTDAIDLNECDKHEGVVLGEVSIGTSSIAPEIQEYSVAFDLVADADPADTSGHYSLWTAFDVIGVAHGMAIVREQFDGGGTGKFTGGLALVRQGDSLKIERKYSGGDRCNGGIEAMKVENGSVVVDNNITSSDFLDVLPGLNPHNLKPYDDLEASALGCIGYLRSVDGKKSAFVPLGKDDIRMQMRDIGRIDKSNNTDKYEMCFLNLMAGVPTDAPWRMTQVREFMTHFNRRCVEGAGK